MLRRLLAATLVLAFAVPVPALAGLLGGGCTMDSPMLASERCDCCTQPAATGSSHCGTAAAATSNGCGCELRADTGSDKRIVVAAVSPNVTFHVEAALIAADLSTPRRPLRDLALAASPPGAGQIVSRPALCTWII